jgi:hypothetical protein
LCYPVTRHQFTGDLLSKPDWVFLPLKDGWIIQTCNILFRPRLVVKNEDFVERFLARRKDMWAVAGTVGLPFMLRFVLSWHFPSLQYDLPEVGHRIEAVTGAAKCQGIVLDSPEIALSINTPGDIAEIEKLLRRRQGAE